MKLQSLLMLALCINTTNNLTVNLFFLCGDNSLQVTIPDAAELTARITANEAQLQISQQTLEKMKFVETFAGATLTTHTISQRMQSLFDEHGIDKLIILKTFIAATQTKVQLGISRDNQLYLVTNQLPTAHEVYAKKLEIEQELYILLLADQPKALQQLLDL